MLSAVSMLSLAPRVVLMVRQEPVPVATGSNDATAMSDAEHLAELVEELGDGRAVGARALEHVARLVEILEPLVLLVLASVEHV